MKRRRTRTTAEIEVETQEVVFTRQRKKPLTAWCPGCARESATDMPEGAARMAGVSVCTIYQWIEAGSIHYSEATEGVLICRASLLRLGTPALPREVPKTGSGM